MDNIQFNFVALATHFFGVHFDL